MWLRREGEALRFFKVLIEPLADRFYGILLVIGQNSGALEVSGSKE
jgi:hypothetical protein